MVITIELSEKEQTALSLLLGLRQKFAREKGETYSALELHKLFSELLQRINKDELRFVETLIKDKTEVKKEKNQDEVWGVVDEAIERSTIKRYDWNKVFGGSLTQEILRIKKEGHNVKEAFEILQKRKEVTDFIDKNKREKTKILENLKISVHARYGENETANKVMRGEDEEKYL